MASDADLRGRRVLVAEDELAIGLLLAEELHDVGARVAGPFGSCAEALLWLADETPDLAILDVGLRDGPCAPLARALRRRDVPFVFFSGTGDLLEWLDADLADAPWVEKPASMKRLIAALLEADAAHRSPEAARPAAVPLPA